MSKEDKTIPEDIPLWQKYTLSVEEAAKYFRIGRAKLRKLIDENANAPYILWNGNRPQIKRKLFEEYIDKINVIQAVAIILSVGSNKAKKRQISYSKQGFNAV